MPDWTWELLFEPFREKGDIILTVSPGGINIWLANAEAIHQVTARRDAFPKPLESYRILEIFGRNIITTEGGEWKQHRKIAAPGFNEKNNTLVFAEAVAQAQGMLRKWMGPDGKGNNTLEEVPTDAMRLTLHIITRIGFGVRLLWPGEKMSFEHSLDTLLENLIWVLLTPKWVLSK
jgi:cytochrome P450